MTSVPAMVALDPLRVKRNLVKHRRALAAGSAFLAVLLSLSAVKGSAGEATDNAAITGDGEAVARWQQLDDNLVAAPIRFADGAATSLLRERDVIDVIAADGLGGSAVVAAHVEVIAVPSDVDSHALADGDQSEMVVLAVTNTQATELAGAGAAGPLSFTLRPPA